MKRVCLDFWVTPSPLAHRLFEAVGEWWRNCLMGILLLLLLTACEHRELTDITNEHYVRIYLNEHLRNVTYGFYDETKEKPKYKSPQTVRVTLSDPTTGKVVSQRYLHDSGTDERGYYLHGYIQAAPGEYDLLAYNFDTEATHINHEASYPDMEVYTNVIDESLSSRLESVRTGEVTRYGDIRYEPDHVFVCSERNVRVASVVEGRDTLQTSTGSHPLAESVTKTYYMQVNVKGVEYVRSAVALITGMSGSVRMHDRSLVPEMESSIYFNLQNGLNKSRTGEEKMAVAYASFNTFGKLPDVEGYIEITFEFNTIYGTTQTETIRVTDMFETEQVREQQWIIIDKVIEIVPPEGVSTGGMTPGVNQWEEIKGDITI